MTPLILDRYVLGFGVVFFIDLRIVTIGDRGHNYIKNKQQFQTEMEEPIMQIKNNEILFGNGGGPLRRRQNGKG